MFRGSECLSSSNASERLSILWSKAGGLSSLNSWSKFIFIYCRMLFWYNFIIGLLKKIVSLAIFGSFLLVVGPSSRLLDVSCFKGTQSFISSRSWLALFVVAIEFGWFSDNFFYLFPVCLFLLFFFFAYSQFEWVEKDFFDEVSLFAPVAAGVDAYFREYVFNGPIW